jgi:hypothetical protein
VYGNIDHAGLRLITCGGTFNRITRHYSHNTVVYAKLVEDAPKIEEIKKVETPPKILDFKRFDSWPNKESKSTLRVITSLQKSSNF